MSGIWFEAVMKKALAIILALLGVSMAAPVTAQFSNGYEFLKAVADKDVMKAQRALSATGNSIINARNPDTGDTALHIAAKRADAPWMKFLLDAGANPEARDGSGDTALIQAVVRNCRDCVITLIAYRADVNNNNEAGETPLIKAVQLRNNLLVRTLLESGARVDLADSVTGLTALEHAERDRRSSQIAQLLREAGKKN